MHFAVGYIDVLHLAPAVLGALVYVMALVLARGYLCDTRTAAAAAAAPRTPPAHRSLPAPLRQGAATRS